MTDKTELLKSFDNSKLIDIVKNYRQYGYDDNLRSTALGILKSRGVDEEYLKMTGNLHNSKFELAEDYYNSFRTNSKLALISYLAAIFLPFFTLLFDLKYGTFLVTISVLNIGSFIFFVLFFIKSLINQSDLYKAIGKENQFDSYYRVTGFLFYFIMYFIITNQMKEDMKVMDTR